MGENREQLKLTTSPKPIELDQPIAWVRKQFAPTLKMLLLIDQGNHTHKINELLNETNLSKKHEKMMEQHIIIIKELMVDDQK